MCVYVCVRWGFTGWSIEGLIDLFGEEVGMMFLCAEKTLQIGERGNLMRLSAYVISIQHFGRPNLTINATIVTNLYFMNAIQLY